ncbi:MAG: hypothetical protein ACI8RA_002389 [Chlamydiales bacterium]|jgi:hypothetical protein
MKKSKTESKIYQGIDLSIKDKNGWTADDWSSAMEKSKGLLSRHRLMFQKKLKEGFDKSIENSCYESAEKIMELGIRGNKKLFNKALIYACQDTKKSLR